MKNSITRLENSGGSLTNRINQTKYIHICVSGYNDKVETQTSKGYEKKLKDRKGTCMNVGHYQKTEVFTYKHRCERRISSQ